MDYCRTGSGKATATRGDEDESRGDTNSISELETDVTSCRWDSLSGRQCFANGGYHKSTEEPGTQQQQQQQHKQHQSQSPRQQMTPC